MWRWVLRLKSYIIERERMLELARAAIVEGLCLLRKVGMMVHREQLVFGNVTLADCVCHVTQDFVRSGSKLLSLKGLHEEGWVVDFQRDEN